MSAGDIETRRNQISKLVEMGFTEQKARIGLKRTRFILLIINRMKF